MQKIIARFKTSWYHWEPCRTGKATDISLLRQFEPIRLDRQIGNFRFMFKIFGRLDIWQEFTGQSFLKSIKSLISLSKIIWQWKVLEHLGDNPPVKACQQKVLFMKDPQLREKIRRFQKIKIFPTLNFPWWILQMARWYSSSINTCNVGLFEFLLFVLWFREVCSKITECR